jgi:hypothetical protein
MHLMETDSREQLNGLRLNFAQLQLWFPGGVFRENVGLKLLLRSNHVYFQQTSRFQLIYSLLEGKSYCIYHNSGFRNFYEHSSKRNDAIQLAALENEAYQQQQIRLG